MSTVNFSNVLVCNVAKTTAQWASILDVITKGVLCVEFADSKTKLKIGDGVNTYSDLPYCSEDVDLSNYYTKTETDSAISTAISGLGNVFVIKGRVDTVNDLPSSNNNTGDVYFVGLETATEYEEYVWTQTRWEYFGKSNPSVDLSNYYTKTETDALISSAEYDDTALSGRVTAIENDYIKSTDKLILSCSIN